MCPHSLLLSMGFPRQEYQIRLPFSSPGVLNLNFIQLELENTLCITSIILIILRPFLWSKIVSTLENVSCAFEKNVHYDHHA